MKKPRSTTASRIAVAVVQALVAYGLLVHATQSGAEPGGTISTVAGTGAVGFAGDGGPALSAQLNRPAGVAVGPDGALYVSDFENNRVRRVDASGVIQTIAGTGALAFGGDGGPATSAAVQYPIGLAFDAEGRLYIADSGNHRVRRVDLETGVITTVAGTGADAYSGDGGPATKAAFGKIYDVAFDEDGHMYVADTGAHRIRRVDRDTGVVTSIAGNGQQAASGDGGPATQAGFKPLALAFDAQGRLYVADGYNHRVRVIDEAGIIRTAAGNGNAYVASAATRTSVLGQLGVRADAPVPGWVVGDGGPATAAILGFPYDVHVDGQGNLIVVDGEGCRIRLVDPSGTIHTVAGDGWADYRGDGGPATQSRLAIPIGMAMDPAGRLYVADQLNHRVRRIIPPFAYGPEDHPPLPPPA